MRFSRVPALVYLGAGLAVGVGLTSLAFRPGREPASPGRVGDDRPQADAPEIRVTTSLSAGDKLALRALIREEFRSLSAEHPRGDEHGEAAAQARARDPGERDVDELTSEQKAAYNESRAMVDSAVKGGIWTDADRDKLHQAMQALPGSLRVDLARPLVAAMNADRVRYVGDGPPF